MTDGSGLPSKLDKQDRKVKNYLGRLPGCQGWVLGDCHARHDGRAYCVYEVFDREQGGHWLFHGPWREWDRVGKLWTHLSWVSETLLQVSPLFFILGPMLPKMKWLGLEEGFVGLSRRRSKRVYIGSITEQNPPRFENLVQLTGFLRLLQTDHPLLPSKGGGEIQARLEARARELATAVEDRIPAKPVFKKWKTFFLRNAHSLANSSKLTLALSFGPYINTCFTYTERGSLLLDNPFFLTEDLVDSDLCRLIIELVDACGQDRQYLIDLYYNLDTPSHFFTHLAHRHMTALLKEIAGDPSRPDALDRLAQLSRSYDLFRTPVPLWYK